MKFTSKYSSLRLIVEPSRTIVEGRSRHIENGLTVEFKDGNFVTKDKELISKLKSLSNYGLDFKSVEAKADSPDKKPASRAKKANKVKQVVKKEVVEKSKK